MSKHVDTRSDILGERADGSDVPLSLVLDRVSHLFGNRCVFSEITGSVRAGQILVITGANGSGKSTLTRIIAGLLRPTSGAVQVTFGSVPADPANARRLFGYVAPGLVLYKELTGVENLRFFAELHGVRADRELLIDLLDRVGLRGRGRDLAGLYSSGMAQRLKYAVALIHNPPVLLLDEPTANLDSDGIARVERIVSAQQSRRGGGLTVVATNEAREMTWSALQINLEASA